MATTRADIDDFLRCNSIAFVGVSRNPRDFSRQLFRELCRRGYQVVPVNPHAEEIEGRPCFSSLQDPRVCKMDPPLEAALLMTSPFETERVVRDCLAAGIRRVWMHRGAGRGAVSPGAVEFCQQNGIRLVEGYCPFLFLPRAQLFHRVHGFFVKLAGHYPASTLARE
jgi:predicted CoA-binding protein